MAMDSFSKDCDRKMGNLFENELSHGKYVCPYYRRVIGTEPLGQVDVEPLAIIEPLSATKSHQSVKIYSTIDRSPDTVNICTNELFTDANPERTKEIQKSKKSTGLNSGPTIVTEFDNSRYKYVYKSDILARNIDDGCSSKIGSPNTNVQISKLSSKTCNSSLKTGKTTSKTDKSRLQTDKSSSQTCCSTLHSGRNGPCKHFVASNKKSSSDEGLCCRICHSVTDIETLVSPCLCTGSMKYVHESCLLNWLKSSVKTKCELCLHEVPVKKLTKPLREVSFTSFCCFYIGVSLLSSLLVMLLLVMLLLVMLMLLVMLLWLVMLWLVMLML